MRLVWGLAYILAGLLTAETMNAWPKSKRDIGRSLATIIILITWPVWWAIAGMLTLIEKGKKSK